ncbi:ribosomal RNA small subunit methyltransferase A [Candidatus Uhrbacteria bacterium RIFCSPHIGHO2_02_FULL_53_13]|uniref:Ribosomal RNA small subunit methyltransferase A n=2 Tax=Candidatus Uhriibacteriota TaxID=1752732 RepID=A0A1F7TWU8_9BACT|nr:MAG: ribosomal RNA small subunit methyltransferase A [Candidatus Uhrbacteria bacterium RIFCSPHIGHO2_02_FULL_53_13]OGL88880.1 MAG: ribosomal RNA small subunit methyltransferase A [Candidatus Uhrbacteria bacterium RIFCSPLOWO2_02_FULL_53_10]
MKPKKFFGQHFLHDQSVVEAIVAAAEISPRDIVLEIGPGNGVLTKRLVQEALRVVAVDIDREAIDTVSTMVAADNLELVLSDILSLTSIQRDDLVGDGYICVGNLPYNISSEVLNTFLTQRPKPLRCVFMLQREVADRLMATAGDMNRLALMVQLHARASRVIQVKPGAFFPPPEVQSTVVRFDLMMPEEQRERGIEDAQGVMDVAAVAFSSKRKQLVTTLVGYNGLKKETIARVLTQMGLPETARPQELSVDQWVELFMSL